MAGCDNMKVVIDTKIVQLSVGQPLNTTCTVYIRVYVCSISNPLQTLYNRPHIRTDNSKLSLVR